MERALKERKDVDVSLTWDLSAIFKTEEEYSLAIEEAKKITSEIEGNYKEKLNSPDIINECLDKMKSVTKLMNLTGSYAYLSLSVDQSNTESQTRYMNLMNILSDLESRLSFVKSEIIEADESVIEEAIKKSKENENYLNEIKRFKPYALHPEV